MAGARSRLSRGPGAGNRAAADAAHDAGGGRGSRAGPVVSGQCHAASGDRHPDDRWRRPGGRVMGVAGRTRKCDTAISGSQRGGAPLHGRGPETHPAAGRGAHCRGGGRTEHAAAPGSAGSQRGVAGGGGQPDVDGPVPLSAVPRAAGHFGGQLLPGAAQPAGQRAGFHGHLSPGPPAAACPGHPPRDEPSVPGRIARMAGRWRARAPVAGGRLRRRRPVQRRRRCRGGRSGRQRLSRCRIQRGKTSGRARGPVVSSALG